MEYSYRLEIPPTDLAAPCVIVQVTAGGYPVSIVAARLGQTGKLSSEGWRMRWARKSAAATVAASNASPLHTGNPACSANAATTGTFRASGGSLGTDGVGLGYLHWNLVNVDMNDLLLPADKIQLLPGETVALNLLSTPGETVNVAGHLTLIETR